jgi:hypothetical protein
VELVIGKKTVFDRPPPGPGLETVTEAVPAVAMSEAATATVNCEPLTKVVGLELPFQFTTEPETKPVPLTVSVKPVPPGTVLTGTSDWLMKGTELGVCASKGRLRRSKSAWAKRIASMVSPLLAPNQVSKIRGPLM